MHDVTQRFILNYQTITRSHLSVIVFDLSSAIPKSSRPRVSTQGKITARTVGSFKRSRIRKGEVREVEYVIDGSQTRVRAFIKRFSCARASCPMAVNSIPIPLSG